MRYEATKVLEENIGCKMPGIGFGNNFFEYDTKSKSNKNKKQVGMHQTKNLHSKRNDQQNEWDNIFINHTSDELIDEELIQLKSEKANNLSEKWAQELNRQFFKEHINGHQVHEERLYIVKHQENADQNEISLHNC